MSLPEWRVKLNQKKLKSLEELFKTPKPVIGMVHLLPLPGSPGYDFYGMDKIIDAALKDAETLLEGGVDGLIVENMWDLPYFVGRNVPPEEMTAQAVAAREIVKTADVPVGINVVHNGGRVCLAIAVAAGAQFIRVCLLTGAQVWDTGEFDHGCAAELLRVRKQLGAEHIKIFADVQKKHAVMFPGIDLATHIEWTKFYLADALIVSGKMTGKAPDISKVKEAKKYAGETPLLLGSGATKENIKDFFKAGIDGVIVGTYLKKGGVAENQVDLNRVKEFVAEVKKVRE